MGRSRRSNTIKLIVISSSFFICLSGYVCAYVHVHLDLSCRIPKSDLLSSKKLFQAVVKGAKVRRSDSRFQES